MSDNLLNKLTQLKLPAMAGSLIRQRETPQTYDELSFIDRNLNPQKIKKTPKKQMFIQHCLRAMSAPPSIKWILSIDTVYH
ncbi:TPA: hypothetical protein ACHK5N_005126 [Escherichia coli]|nr:hypothetical protein [Escherichia coli]